MILDEHNPEEQSRPRKRWLRALAFAFGVLVLLFVGLIAYSHTESFHNWVHAKVISDLETATGGRVELGQLTWTLSKLNFEAHGLVIHGLESPDQAPYVRAEKIVVDAKVLSWVGRQVGLRAIQIDHPVIHYIVYPDGHTNQPKPKADLGKNTAQPIFDLKLDRAEVLDGVLIVNDKPIRFDFSADNVQAAMSYVAKAERYDGHASIGNMRTTYRDLKPFQAGASADFSLFPNQIQVKGLHLSAGKSVVDASGRVLDFADPRADLSYTASIDLAQAGDILLLPQLRRGTMTLKGTGQYTTKDYGTTGNLTLASVEYRDRTIALTDLNGGADYVADQNNFSLTKLFVHIFGGTAVGNGEIKNWSASPAAAGAHSPEREGLLRLKVQGVPVSRVAAAVSTRAMPLERFHAVGSANGTIDVAWRGMPSRARTQFAINVTPPANATNAELPVTAIARGTYFAASQQFDLSQLDLGARSIQVKATGTMSRNAKLNVSAVVSDLRDVSPLLTAWNPQEALPGELTGRGTFSGTLAGKIPSAPVVAGHIELADVQAPLPFRLPAPAAIVLKPITSVAPPPASSTPRVVHFDSVAGDIRWSNDEFAITNGIVKRGSEQLTLSATIGLVQGRFVETNAIAAKAGAKNFQVADITSLIGYTFPITGTVNGELDIRGTEDDPRGAAQLQITNGTLYRQPFQRASAYVTFVNGGAEFSNVLITRGTARVTGDANYNLKSTAFRFNLAGANFNLAEFPQLQGTRVKTAGVLSFNARGSGSKEAPAIDADLHLRNFTMNGERLGNLDGTAKTTGNVMRVNARSDFPIADFEVNGTVAMGGDFTSDLAVKMTRLDVDPLLQMFVKARITGHSSVSGNITIAGPLRTPRLLTVAADFDHFSAEIENVKLQNDGPLRIAVKDRVLRLEQFKLAGSDTTVTASGTMALTGNQAVDLRADGRVNLVLLQSLRSDIHSSGLADFDMRAGGTMLRPVFFGTMKISNGAFADVNFPNGISNLNGTLVFNQDRIQIQTLTGSSGGGDVNLGGFVSYGTLLTFNLTAGLKDVRVRYPQGMSETLNGDLSLTGTRNNSTLTGEITVTRFSVNQNFDVAVAIAASKQPPVPPDPTSWLNNLRLNLKVNSAPDLQVTSSLAKLSGDVNLNIRGTATRPAVLGRINVTEGQLTFNGMNFQLDRGDVSFSNPIKIEPVVDMAATTRVRDYDVTLGFHGPLDRLSTTYRSDPPLPTADIISLLAFGKTREESEMANAAQPTYSESATNAILGQALNSAVSSRVQKLFGVSRIKISPELGGAQTDPNAQVTIEQQVSKDFTVTYITDLTHTSTSNQQYIQVEYNYSRNLSIIGSRDQYGIVSFDVRIRQRRK